MLQPAVDISAPFDCTASLLISVARFDVTKATSSREATLEPLICTAHKLCSAFGGRVVGLNVWRYCGHIAAVCVRWCSAGTCGVREAAYPWRPCWPCAGTCTSQLSMCNCVDSQGSRGTSARLRASPPAQLPPTACAHVRLHCSKKSSHKQHCGCVTASGGMQGPRPASAPR